MNTNFLFQRSTFVGQTDRYRLNSQPNGQPALDVVAGRPVTDFERIVGTILGDGYVSSASSRLSKYVTCWDYYLGRLFAETTDGLIEKSVVNWCSMIARKRAAWAVGRAVEMLPSKGNELVAEVLEDLWKHNNGRDLWRRTVRTGLVTGDAFWHVSLVTKTPGGQDLPPSRQFVRVHLLNPSYCFPVWSDTDPEKMEAMVLHFPILYKDSASATPRDSVFTMVVSEKSVQRYRDGQLVSTSDNPIGIIPFVHYKHGRTVDHSFGVSIMDELGPLTRDYNLDYHALRRLIRYCGEPTTLVYGMRLTDMERGAHKIWSGLPENGKVEMLDVPVGSLEAIVKSLELKRNNILLAGQTPLIAFDSQGYSVANASGIAMSLLFQPLVEASADSQEELCRCICEAHKIIFALHNKFLEPLDDLADDPARAEEVHAHFTSMLPTDDSAELDRIIKMVEAKLLSRAEAIRRVSKVRDTRRHSTELLADTMQDTLVVGEKQRVLDGKPINPASLLIGSPFIHEDLIKFAESFQSEVAEDPKSTDSSGEANQNS